MSRHVATQSVSGPYRQKTLLRPSNLLTETGIFLLEITTKYLHNLVVKSLCTLFFNKPLPLGGQLLPSRPKKLAKILMESSKSYINGHIYFSGWQTSFSLRYTVAMMEHNLPQLNVNFAGIGRALLKTKPVHAGDQMAISTTAKPV